MMSAQLKIVLPEPITCQRERCGYRWQPRVANPKRCPHCHQDWRKPLKDLRSGWENNRRKTHPHGSRSRYVRGCRCEPCTEANRAYEGERRTNNK